MNEVLVIDEGVMTGTVEAGITFSKLEEALAQARDLMETLIRIGAVPHREGTDFLAVLTEKLDPGYRDLTTRIKAILDPNGVMSQNIP